MSATSGSSSPRSFLNSQGLFVKPLRFLVIAQIVVQPAQVEKAHGRVEMVVAELRRRIAKPSSSSPLALLNSPRLRKSLPSVSSNVA